MTHKFFKLKKQQGVALLAALILIMALVLVLGNIFYRHQIDVARLTKMLHSDQAILMAISVESWAGQLLSNEADNRAYDNLEERWSIAVPILPIDGGFIRGCIVDLQAKINLNSFSEYDNADWEEEFSNDGNGLAKTWLALLSRHDLPSIEDKLVSIIDWVDEDNDPFDAMGAEQFSYDASRSPVMVTNSLLSETAELSVIRGYDLSQYQILEPYISALPRASAININTASEQVLLAVGGAYAETFAEFVLNNRPFFSLGDFQQSLSTYLTLPLVKTSALWAENFVSVKSDYFLLSLQLTLGDARLEIHSIMDRYNREEAVIISRSVSVIPEIIPSSLGISDEDDLAPVFCANTESESS